MAPPKIQPKVTTPSAPKQADALAGGLSADFRSFLETHGYDVERFARDDVKGGSFGGKRTPGEKLTHQPVIFIHGNSDSAVGPAGLGGFRVPIEKYLAQGYQPSELYAFTWGDAKASHAALNYHSKKNVESVRQFIEAVLEYTGASQVDVVSHSMGVTLARGAIKGGVHHDLLAGGKYDLGKPLTDKVDTFVGIAGGNEGLASAVLAPMLPTASPTNGFYPGVPLTPLGPIVGRSRFLEELDENPAREGQHVYSIWSPADELAGLPVYGKPTSRIRGQDGEKVYSFSEVRKLHQPGESKLIGNHLGLKSGTADVVLEMIEDHQVK
ncbi:MAG: lipase [Myxococcaceae bacterium]|nr:lipase [Myxococcaceae bacterium]